MAKLPQRLTLQDTQVKWASIIDPVVANPANNSLILQNVSLVTGSNVINHNLGQPLQGWKIVRQRATAAIHDNQDSNQMPQLTLVLVSSAPVSIDLEVY